MKELFPLIIVLGIGINACTVAPTDNNTNITVPDGFRVQKLLASNQSEMGSWVSLTHVAGNRFVASDQYGKIYRIEAPAIGSTDSATVEPLELTGIGKAQGLLWTYNSLYIMVNDQNTEKSGLYRAMDTDYDGLLDSLLFMQHLNGWGEHGPHGVVLGPDGYLYAIAGNHTDLPDSFTSIQQPVWDEDRLHVSMKDPNGHAREIEAPGGWIARTDSSGSFWEIISSGYRNAYDLAFNEHGELFTFDSDMEWDLGLPWYRPVRVCHVTMGSEFGWRTGSGKWPAYYPDNLAGVLDVGQGSPTGIVSAMEAGFPAPYDQGLFICDWSFGTMYHVNLKPQGASYTGELSEFLSGIPLPLTDVDFGDDGAMYFTTGGRRLESGLFRVWYTGDKQSSPTTETTPEILLRRQVEKLQDPSSTPNPDTLWSYLGYEDRFIRYGARIAIENHGPKKWASHFLKTDHIRTLIGYAIAVARMGDSDLQSDVFKTLRSLDVTGLSVQDQLGIIRAQGLLITRNPGLRIADLENQWAGVFPATNVHLNEEIAYLFTKTTDPAWLNSIYSLWTTAEAVDTTIIIDDQIAERSEQYGPAVLNMKKRKPSAHRIALMDAMSKYTSGWTEKLRETYFTGFNGFWDREGGYSYRGYMLNILENALESAPKTRKTYYRRISGADLGNYGQNVLADLPVPEGPGRNWTADEVVTLMSEEVLDPDYVKGAIMFDAALCRTCHVIRGQGSNLGPDLTQLGTRFTVRDIAVALIDPNKEVSDQYMISDFELQDGSQFRGKVVREMNDTLHIMANPLIPDDLRMIAKEELKEETKSNQSLMFPALLNRLNEQEVYDLMTYLLAGADENHDLYQ